MEHRKPWRNYGPDPSLQELTAGTSISPLRWVPPESSRTTRTDRELEKSAQRSHAAKVSHQRRKGKFHLIVQTQYHAPSRPSPDEFHTYDTEQGGPLYTSALRMIRLRSERRRDDENALSTKFKRHVSEPIKTPSLSQLETPMIRHWGGASDPFAAYPIAVTPWVNHTIRFFRETWIPASYHWTHPTSVRFALAERELRDSKYCLSFEAPAHAILTMSMVLMVHHQPTPDVEQRVLLSKIKSLASLRKLLTHYSVSESMPIIACIIYLLGAAVCANDLEEAEIHARTLKRFFETRTVLEPGSIEYTFFIRCLRFCIRHATLNLAAPTFDLDVHVSDLLRDSFRPGDLFFDTCPQSFDKNLDVSLREPLKDIIIRLRKGFWLWQQRQFHGIAAHESADWAIGQYYVSQGQLLHIYDDRRSKLSTALHEDAVRLRIEMCLALGVLCILNSGDLVGVSTQDCAGILLRALQQHVVVLMGEQLETQAESHDYEWENSKLWFLFVGWFVDRGRTRSASKDSFMFSFSERLAVHVFLMGLETWEQMVTRLQKFFFFEEMKPSGLSWFTDTILASADSVRHAGRLVLKLPKDYPARIFKPKLPDNYEDMDETEKELAECRFKQVMAAKAYELRCFLDNQDAYNAMNMPLVYRELFVCCGETWKEGPAPSEGRGSWKENL